MRLSNLQAILLARYLLQRSRNLTAGARLLREWGQPYRKPEILTAHKLWRIAKNEETIHLAQAKRDRKAARKH